MSKQDLNITVSNRTLVRLLLFIVGSVLLFRFINNVLHPLTLIFVSVFLAIALNPFVSFVKRKLRIKRRGAATAIAYLIALFSLGLFFALIVPPFIQQTIEFIQTVPDTISKLESQSNVVGQITRDLNISQEIKNFTSDISTIGDTALNTANRVVANIVSIVTVLILTFMMLTEGPKVFAWFTSQFSKTQAERIRKLSMRMYNIVTGYVNGQVVIAVMAGFFSLIMLIITSSILGVTINAVALAALVTLFGLIPTIGSFINAFLITFFCLLVSPTLAIIMLVYYIIYQQIENATIQPLIQSKTNELTPLTVFIAALLGIGFGGILGALVAIPIAGCAKILLEDWLDDRRINASTPDPARSAKNKQAIYSLSLRTMPNLAVFRIAYFNAVYF